MTNPIQHPTPLLVVSRCLGFEACRYDGEIIRSEYLRRIAAHAEIRAVCPEMDIGMGVPREPVRLVEQDGQLRMLEVATGHDHTPAMHRFCRDVVGELGDIDGFVLKTRSPSCGITDAKVYPTLERSPTLRSGPGMFTAAVQAAYPTAAFIDEGRLTSATLRHHFLTRVFTTARFRRVRQENSMDALVRFQTINKHLLMAYNQSRMRAMGRIVANHDRLPVSDVLTQYQEQLGAALARSARHTAHVNVLEHGFGYVSEGLSAPERRYFLDLLRRFRARTIPIVALLSVLHGWIVRFEVKYLANQTYFEPYPTALTDLADSGKRQLD